MTGCSDTQFDTTLFIIIVVVVVVSTLAFTYMYISSHTVAEDTTSKLSMPGFSEWGRTGVLEFKLFPLIFLLRSYVVQKNSRVFLLYFCSAILFATPNGIDNTNLNPNVTEKFWCFKLPSPKIPSIKMMYFFCILGFRHNAVFSLCSWWLLCHRLLSHP